MRLNAPHYPFVPKPPIYHSYRNKAIYNNNFEVKKETSKNSPSAKSLGVNLEFDDLLILGLLLFLFAEGVDDEILYIILFMLLLS